MNVSDSDKQNDESKLIDDHEQTQRIASAIYFSVSDIGSTDNKITPGERERHRGPGRRSKTPTIRYYRFNGNVENKRLHKPGAAHLLSALLSTAMVHGAEFAKGSFRSVALANTASWASITFELPTERSRFLRELIKTNKILGLGVKPISRQKAARSPRGEPAAPAHASRPHYR
ncbi:hypothetical protein EVAR_41728_1 [Eumeta japonica]|uniref:Uncharacterized protein n=1 Tax=Eumeta variegata TaxID=151549 RepID=A0A4C1XFF8_EUMVA|nr:hypothetical protein EVAR_41728_1 [Eumeta japonica]